MRIVALIAAAVIAVLALAGGPTAAPAAAAAAARSDHAPFERVAFERVDEPHRSDGGTTGVEWWYWTIGAAALAGIVALAYEVKGDRPQPTRRPERSGR